MERLPSLCAQMRVASLSAQIRCKS
ncbi:hypothetical protein F8388_006328 [Cannabis sativa]|uniref:Uncharacterized protein n=1 Tax=Cannabis sativa TaxID=3483 RepID=A0A7J6EE26_CANSA|nr:hypothetical protein F8388_006328 [Cannabis sativa]